MMDGLQADLGVAVPLSYGAYNNEARDARIFILALQRAKALPRAHNYSVLVRTTRIAELPSRISDKRSSSSFEAESASGSRLFTPHIVRLPSWDHSTFPRRLSQLMYTTKVTGTRRRKDSVLPENRVE